MTFYSRISCSRETSYTTPDCFICENVSKYPINLSNTHTAINLMVKSILLTTAHRGAFCQFSFRWMYYYGSNKANGKETGKTHLCALFAYIAVRWNLDLRKISTCKFTYIWHLPVQSIHQHIAQRHVLLPFWYSKLSI